MHHIYYSSAPHKRKFISHKKIEIYCKIRIIETKHFQYFVPHPVAGETIKSPSILRNIGMNLDQSSIQNSVFQIIEPKFVKEWCNQSN
jgi:hypothetical protein